jgi:hypothetical protein
MPETTLLYNPTLATIDTITVDASISEQHNSEVEVTDHQVEQGATISDHARVRPVTLALECIVSNTPITAQQAQRIVESDGFSFTATSPIQGYRGHAEQTFNKLEALRDECRLITVVTALKTYTNMILTSLSVPRNASTGEALRFSATFKSVTLVKNQTTTEKITKTTQGKKKKSLGKQPTETAPNSTKLEQTLLLKGTTLVGITE